MIWCKAKVPIIYIEDADFDMVEEIEKVNGVLTVIIRDHKTYVIIEPDANLFEVEIDLREIME